MGRCDSEGVSVTVDGEPYAVKPENAESFFYDVIAAKINNAVNLEDYAEARRLAGTGRVWIIVSVIVGILKWCLFCLVYVGFLGLGAYYY